MSRAQRSLDHDAIKGNRFMISSSLFEHDLSENRFPLFRIMLWRAWPPPDIHVNERAPTSR
jgi:hypothetical protein